jgi:tetratricopeptide (TPR) repeat protein
MTAKKSKLPGGRPLARAGVAGAVTMDRRTGAGRGSDAGWLGGAIPTWALWPLLVIVTAAAYYPAWHGGLLWDDPAHITRPELRSLGGLWRIWFDIGATQQYYPVTHSAFWVMHRLWGDQTLGYHLVNIALHAWSAFMIAVLLRRLAVPGALLAAAIFALHPVHVESVAWMTELKNTLSGALYLGAAWWYLNFDDSRKPKHYVAAFALFVLALLSKTVTVTLPAALLVVFWWKRGRVRWREDVIPLLPWFIVGIAGGLFTAWVERTYIGAEGAEFQFTFVERVLMAGRVVWFYLSKLVWPVNLMFIYPRWHVSQAVWWQYLYPLAALGLLAAAWALRPRWRGPLAALLLFGGTLAPALGFVNVYPFQFSLVADHFQYLASAGVIALVAAALTLGAARWQVPVGAQRAGAATLLTILAVLTWRQSVPYADLETLYRTTIARNPACFLCENNLGVMKLDGGGASIAESVGHFRRALEIKADYAPAHNNLGSALQHQGHADAALAEFAAAVHLQPRFTDARVNQANALRTLGRLPEAKAAYLEALALNPGHVEARTNLAGVLLRLGDPEGAVTHLTEAFRRRPADPMIRANLASAWTAVGQAQLGAGHPAEAIAPLQEALRVDPASAEAHTRMAEALLQLGRPQDAVPHLQEVVRLLPSSAAARANLDNVLAAMR